MILTHPDRHPSSTFTSNTESLLSLAGRHEPDGRETGSPAQQDPDGEARDVVDAPQGNDGENPTWAPKQRSSSTPSSCPQGGKRSSRCETPLDYVNFLSAENMSADKLFRGIESLRVALTNNPVRQERPSAELFIPREFDRWVSLATC